jgi:hypothetical protein
LGEAQQLVVATEDAKSWGAAVVSTFPRAGHTVVEVEPLPEVPLTS